MIRPTPTYSWKLPAINVWSSNPTFSPFKEHRVDDYQRTIRTLSDRIVLAQTPIRVLDAVKWDDSIRQGFF